MMAASRESALPLLATPAFARFTDRLRENADLSKTNWFRVGGAADYLFRPEDAADLAAFFALLPASMPITILGVGSNIIIRDGGIEGVVIKLGRGFNSVSRTGNLIEAGGAVLDLNVAKYACENGIAGLEFLSGIPGTIGGAVRMNAGAYGSDVAAILTKAEIVERSGKIRELTAAELGFVYRNSALPEGAVVTRAWFEGTPGDTQTIAAQLQDIATAREETQPIRSRTGGSTFKNPEGHKAWELIDKAGCRGMSIGDAQVSEKHCNFLINNGDATAAQLESLGEKVREQVKAKTGIQLEWEIKRIGRPS